MNKFLVFGNKGQLGREFCKRFEADNITFRGYDLDEVDIADAETVQSLIAADKPEFIINCAAYNLVDRAEENYNAAYNSNALGVKNIAQAAENNNAFLIHYGTDYVFDGYKGTPYDEEDEPHPLNNYGKSKLAGEELLKSITDKYLLFRVSWVYGDGAQNFIYKLKNWAEQKDILRIADDEISVPTSTQTIVEMTLKSLDMGLNGLFHLTNSGHTSRYFWAAVILKNLGIEKEINPVSKDIFNLPAKRPGFSAMNNDKLSHELNTLIPGWEDALRLFISKAL